MMAFRQLYKQIIPLAVLASLAMGQAGDHKDRDGESQVDPIPATEIPGSPYLDLKDALAGFRLADGFVIEPVAYGVNVDLAVALAFDGDGRAWTCEMRSYMPNLDGTGELSPTGRIRILQDTTGDGVMDRAITFLDGLVLPRAIAVTSDGCLYTSGDTLYFIRRQGLKPIGEATVVDAEYASGGNPEHKANGLVYGHDNWYYSAKSNKRYRRIDGQWIRQVTNFRGQWGITKDNAGHLYHNSNSTLLVGEQFRPQFFRGVNGFTPKSRSTFQLGSNRVFPIHITPGVNRAYMQGTLGEDGKLINATATCGIHIYRGDNFPTASQGMAFSCEPAGDLIKAIRVERDEYNIPSGSHPYGKQEFLATKDEWFLPCNLYTAPDGTLWFVDMYFGLLQHRAYMTTYLRKQYVSRGLDKPKASTGRIYRIRYGANPARRAPKMQGLSPDRLLKFLAHANGQVRDTAQRLIVEAGSQDVAPALAKMAAESSNPWAQIHALWTLHGLDHDSPTAFTGALKSSHTDVTTTVLDIVANRRITDQATGRSVAQFQPGPRELHSHVRALAATGHADQALQSVLAHPQTPLLREAFLSGLGDGLRAFRLAHNPIDDKALQALLSQAVESAPKQRSSPPLSGSDLAAFQRGSQIYAVQAACSSCHGSQGAGLPNLGPPLVASEWVTGDASRLSKILLHGMQGPVLVGGTEYSPPLAMPGLADNPALSDQHLADVMTFVRNSWGNHAQPVTAEQVSAARSATATRSTPYKASQLAR